MISVIVLDPCADRGSEKSGAARDLSVSETAAEVDWNFSVSKSMLLAALEVDETSERMLAVLPAATAKDWRVAAPRAMRLEMAKDLSMANLWELVGVERLE